jgi:O-antigen/teichoic acid export membrane protein
VSNLNTNEVKKTMVKDTLLYLPARLIEGLIGLATITLYTSFFAPEIYGYYGLITTTVNIGSFLLLGWLNQAVYRYVNAFEGKKRGSLFYSTSFTLWLCSNVIVVILGFAGILIVNPRMDAWVTQLFVLTLFMFVTYNTTQVLLSIVSATRKVKLLLFLSLFSVTMKLLLTVFFVYKFQTNSYTPAAAVLSNVIVDTVVILIAMLRLKVYKHFTFKYFSKSVLTKFLTYSLPLVGVNFTMSVLNLSDRYVIAPVLGPEQMGIYHANYTISSTVFNLILVAVMRGVYPMILKTWSQNNRQRTEYFLSQAVRYYLLVSTPALTGLCILSGPISKLFLDAAYFEHGFVITWVAIGMFLYGLAEYSNKAWELTSNTKPLFYNTVISAVLNLGLNIIFVGIYGYRIAAINTAISYLLYLALSLYRSRKIMKITFSPKSLAKILLSCIIMGLTVYFAIHSISLTVINLILTVIIGCLVYFICLILLREIKTEIDYAVNWIKNFRK